MGRHSVAKPAAPDDPIYKSGLTIYTPLPARPKPPEPPVEKDEPEE